MVLHIDDPGIRKKRLGAIATTIQGLEQLVDWSGQGVHLRIFSP